jgi:hypothetical protein
LRQQFDAKERRGHGICAAFPKAHAIIGTTQSVEYE